MDQFEILCLVGEGSFGKVYKAKMKTNGDTVALKVIRKHSRSAKELVNFHRECEIQQHLKHPNIIRMLDSFDTPSHMVVVTEFAHKELHSILAKEGSLGEEKSRELSWDLVSALYYLHSHRILHRDLKPQNILQDVEGRFKLCDFGLARSMTTGTHVLTSIKGTPLYMAPELMSEQPYDHQADLWSLGCIIYETLVGEPPFSTTSILHLIQLIKHEHIRWPSFISKECISFLQGLLQKDPANRMPWQEILQHTFVQGHIHILDETSESPFTHPLSESQCKAKEQQHSEAMGNKSYPQHCSESSTIPEENYKETSSTVLENETENESTHSSDSVKNALSELSLRDTLKTDLGTTDVEGNISEFEIDIKTVPKVDGSNKPVQLHFVPGLNSNNLVINNMNNNIEELNNISKVQPNTLLKPVLLSKSKLKEKETPPSTSGGNTKRYSDAKYKKGHLEKRKLSQNLDNFSLKLSQIDTAQDTKEVKSTNKSDSKDKQTKNERDGMDTLKKSSKGKSLVSKFTIKKSSKLKSSKESLKQAPAKIDTSQDDSSVVEKPKITPDVSKEPLDTNLLGIEQPIENEEWLDFIHKTMLEVLEGDLESMKQQNLVSIIVSPLRHNNVSDEVAKSVAQLLAMPLVVTRNLDDLDVILKVYYDVKVVPNLVYASVLLCGRKELIKRDQLSAAEIIALQNMYLLVCNLVHSREQFVVQYCEALFVLKAKTLTQEFLVIDSETALLVSDVVAILCNVLYSLPENAELVEDIVLEGGLERILSLLAYPDNLLRQRTCNLVRLLGRFCCAALQTHWSGKIRKSIEALIDEEDVNLSMTAEETSADLKSLPFYDK